MKLFSHRSRPTHLGLYPADVLPPGDALGVAVKLIRKEAVVHGEQAESPAAARQRSGHHA